VRENAETRERSSAVHAITSSPHLNEGSPTVSADQIRETCWDCNGTTVKGGLSCSMCEGTGVITTTPLVPKK
jgi:DnaJ-class molecular chaperone